MDVPAIVGGRIESVLVKVGDKVPKARRSRLSRRCSAAPFEGRAEQTRAEAIRISSRLLRPNRSQQPHRQATCRHQRSGFFTSPCEPVGAKACARTGRGPRSGQRQRRKEPDSARRRKGVRQSDSDGQALLRRRALPKTPSVDFAKFGEIDVQPLTRIQKISGPRLQASWINLPHVTQHDLADITDLESEAPGAKGRGERAWHIAYAARIRHEGCVAALQEYPKVNSSLSDDGKNLVFKKYIHLGFAADTEQGLMVPVIRDADQKDVYELGAELGELSCAGSRRQAEGRPAAGCDVYGLQPRRYWWHGVYADRQCSRGRDTRGLAFVDAAGLERVGVRAATDVAAVVVLRSPRHRWRGCGPVYDFPRQSAGRCQTP